MNNDCRELDLDKLNECELKVLFLDLDLESVIKIQKLLHLNLQKIFIG